VRTRVLGRTGLEVSVISLGSWLTFGGSVAQDTAIACIRRAFELGVTLFDTANVYERGGAEEVLGRALAPLPRDGYVVATKVFGEMGPGPDDRGLGQTHVREQCHASLRRLAVDVIDLYQCHRYDPETPLEETMGALDSAVRAGKALYVGISSYSAAKTAEAAAILRELRTPFVIHQPSYSLLNRWIEPDLLDVLGELGIGCIVFSPLAQGMLTNRYLDGIPEGSRAATRGSALSRDLLTDDALGKIRALNEIAGRRGQSLAQMAIAWVLRDERVTSALIGASSVSQLEDSLGALDRLDFTEDELSEIDRYATDAGLNLWAASSAE
jgi:L-glyceraldehyde 3-phosphate reductase